jgi:site-specific recombinase XerD
MRTSEGIGAYLLRKRAVGQAFETAEFALSAFCRFTGDLPLEQLVTRHILDFLNSRNSSAATWRAKHRTVRQFCEFWADRGAMPALLMPQLRLPKHEAPLPVIYSATEVRSLICATRDNQRHHLCAVNEQTLRAVLLALYGTGATTREILRLKCEDLDLKRRIINVCGDRIVEPRRIPISNDVSEIPAHIEWNGCPH